MRKKNRSITIFLKYLLHHPKYEEGTICIYFSSAYKMLATKLSDAIQSELPQSHCTICLLDKTPLKEKLELFHACNVAVFLYDKFKSQQDFEKYSLNIRPFLNKIKNNLLKTIFLVEVAGYFDEIFSISPRRIASLHRKLIDAANQSKIMRIQSSLGSKVTIDLTSCKPWTSLDGINYGEGVPSEITTYTKNINGTFVFTGLILCPIPFSKKYGVLKKPVTFEIKNGTIVSADTENQELTKDLEYYFQYHDTHRKIEEIGIGTNEGLLTLKGTSGGSEERHAGLHFGLGGKKNKSIHLDLISADSQIYFDEKMIFNDKFLL